jgi:hypothetical protein
VIDASRLLAGLPQGLRGELLESYQKIISNYFERRWEPSELNAGKFCEVIYSIVDGALNGTFPAKASKPSDMVAACRALEQTPPGPNRVGDRSFRIMIPRTLPMLYEIRNNRGVGHVGGDVDANHMDAEAVQATASWLMAELVRVFHGVRTEEAREAIDALVERKTPAIWQAGGKKRVLDSSLSAKVQTLMLLHHEAGWVSATDLCEWVGYSSLSAFRGNVLKQLHEKRMIEFDVKGDRALISPQGSKEVEDRFRKVR